MNRQTAGGQAVRWKYWTGCLGWVGDAGSVVVCGWVAVAVWRHVSVWIGGMLRDRWTVWAGVESTVLFRQGGQGDGEGK